MRYAHTFRRDKENHVVLTNAPKVRRDGRHRAICGPRVDDTFQRRISSGTVIAPVTCPTCLSFMVALQDILEAEDAASALVT